ncbi:ribosomal protection-like ABC-F family protein [Domibacillus indicus]|uniref:ribosomal protection-like ABC-F family protein n=1 Tax=Domibacillus indicus TaxID=1437523 RepID=UPI00061813DC|nr:ABC-F type ribosomal protection protein [Domibacillus indicus]
MNIVEAKQIRLEAKDRLLASIEHLVIQEKDRIGLVGKNGSGKTTLLHVLAGKAKASEGTIIRRGLIELLPQLKRADLGKSGGEITQRYVNEAFYSGAKLLLADEPTAHLDRRHVEWVEKKLVEWPEAFVVVSHDRAFLDAVCTTIWEITETGFYIYKGNYSAYEMQKEERRHRNELEAEKYEQTKRKLEQAIAAKQKKAKRAVKKPKSVGLSEARNVKPYYAKKQKKLQTAAKSLETRLEKLEKIEKPQELPPVQITAQHQESLKGRVVIRAEKVEGKAGKQDLWKAADFFIYGGDKTVLIGPNGSGKTTLLEKIVHRHEGISIAPAVSVGYFSQHLTILKPSRTIIENVKEASGQDESLIRTVLARIGFWGEDVFKKVSVLSGGERVKTALVKLLVSDANVLILDEPTNFLDIQAVEALESLLAEYRGTVLFTSHDRRFAERIATNVLAIEDGKLAAFTGTLHEYKEKKILPSHNEKAEKLLLLETKIAEVVSRLSLEPADELEQELKRLLRKKQALTK